jgi:hypothetical protein
MRIAQEHSPARISSGWPVPGDTGWVDLTTFSDDNALGTITWTIPGNAVAEDGASATAFSTSAGVTTHYLKGLALNGVSVPAGATIQGVEVRAKKARSATGVTDAVVSLVKGGAIGGDNNASGSDWPAALAYTTYGANNDMWGLALTPDDVNGATFGAVLACTIAPQFVTALIDHLQIKVVYEYTP